MTIRFSCQSCDSDFGVDDKLAGKKARCNHCGNRMTIPAVPQERKAALPAAAAMARQTKASAAKGNASMNWMDAVSQLKLKPISAAMSPAVRRILDKPEDSITSYKIDVPRENYAGQVLKKQIASEAARAADAMSATNYRFFNKISRVLRHINDATYGISVVFLIVACAGVIMDRHPLVVFGVSMIVLLNIVGLVSGVANLIAINFRKNPVRGLLFLIPPVTLYYLSENWSKWHKPIGRIATPALILLLVGLAYAYLPVINGDAQKNRSLSETVDAIKSDVSDSLKQAQKGVGDLKDQLPNDLKQLNVDDLKKQANDAVGGISNQIQKATGNEASAGTTPVNPGREGSP